MPPYLINISAEARRDILDTYKYIAHVLFEPDTADKYQKGILDCIAKLAFHGGAFAISQRAYVQYCWGPEARTISYKNMTIVYNLIGNMVLVRRVIASSMVL
ncbi:hypothetical protein FACS189430_07430 [Bacteroidia bacterium]|nr:hypothetical protein FACS189430_07430 [Bacteroidia bacterium]